MIEAWKRERGERVNARAEEKARRKEQASLRKVDALGASREKSAGCKTRRSVER